MMPGSSKSSWVPNVNAPLLEAKGIDAGYGHIQVLWKAGLRVDVGEAIVLIGANGAGKTTFIRSVMGLLPVWHGELRFAGADITSIATDRRVRSGIAYMSEMGCFSALSVEDNIRIGGQFLSHQALQKRIDILYTSFPLIKDRRRAAAGSLSGGQRKILGIAKALASDPKLLIMDEPSAGLSPLFVNEVINVLHDFRGRGLSLFIAEQNVQFLELADRVYVLEGGRMAFEGTTAQLQADNSMQRAYFGIL
jgi:branched-chain amino acid transport system ATP-binding protein